jgi:isopenicillin-N N-acyltransferase-like protein
MGRQYGEQARSQIRENRNVFGRNWNLEKARKMLRANTRILKEKLPEVLEEMTGIAEGAGLALDEIILLNCVDTIGEDWFEECTPVGLKDSPAGPIIAKNNDGATGTGYRYVIRKSFPDHGLPMLQLTYAGWLSGLDAMNAAGLANTHGSVGSSFDKAGPRVDIRLQGYQLMRTCRKTKEFIAGLMAASLTGKGFSIVAGDQTGTTAVVEAAVPLIQVRDLNKAFIYSTNLYMHPAIKTNDMRSPAKRYICEYRFGYLKWVEDTKPPENVEDVKKLLGCHEPWAPCRHGGPHGSETEWSMINLPKKGQVLVADGFPCKTPFIEYEI